MNCVQAVWVAAWVVLKVAYIAPSSIYMVRSLCYHDWVISRRLDIYNAESMDESSDPCRVPLLIEKGSDVKFPILMVAWQLLMSEQTHLHTSRGKPLSLRIWAIQLGLRLLKKPDMLKRRRAPALFVAHVA